MTLAAKLQSRRHLIPVVLLIAAVLGSIYAGIATATEAAALGVVGALADLGAAGIADLETFRESLMGGTRLYCMIALILAGAAFLTLGMGFIGLPRHLAEWIGALGLRSSALIAALMAFYIVLGCFLDGISMVVLTMAVILPTVQKAGIDLLWFGIFVVARRRDGADHAAGRLQPVRAAGHDPARDRLDLARRAAVLRPHVAAVALLYVFPQLVTFLPQQMSGSPI